MSERHTHTLTVIQKANREYRPYRHKDNHTHRDKPNIMTQTAIQRYKQPHTNMSRIDTHKQLNRDKWTSTKKASQMPRQQTPRHRQLTSHIASHSASQQQQQAVEVIKDKPCMWCDWEAEYTSPVGCVHHATDRTSEWSYPETRVANIELWHELWPPCIQKHGLHGHHIEDKCCWPLTANKEEHVAAWQRPATISM